MKMAKKLAVELQKAGIRAEAVTEPVAAAWTNVFQIDIANRGRSGREKFRFYEGSDTSMLKILDTEPHEKQALIRVRERSVEFKDTETFDCPQRGGESVKSWKSRVGVDYENRTGRKAIRVRVRDSRRPLVDYVLRTSPTPRNYLIGMDETNYFIAEVGARVKTVNEAHDALRPKEARREGSLRQGEWFFIPLTNREEGALEARIAQFGGKPTRRIGKGALYRMGTGNLVNEWRRNTRHLVSELTEFVDRIPNWNDHSVIDEGTRETYARGTVSHLRHSALDLGAKWHRVVHNLEKESDIDRVGWVD